MGFMHPEIVHFAIALLFVGVALRALSLLTRERVAFIGPAAALLIGLGTLAVVAAAYTGDAAHPPVEAMPGLRAIVSEHEEWGEWTRNIFLVVLLIELVALALRTPARARIALIASTVVGVIGLGALYEAGEHGGQIVYAYAGGVGIRSGQPQDVGRLFLAGLYQQALVERKAGNKAKAAALLDQAAREFPNDVEVMLARAESILVDRGDPASALTVLQSVHPPRDNRFVRFRHAMLTADALVATGQREGAIATLQQLNTDLPNPRIQQRIDAIKRMPAPDPQR